MLFLSSQLSSCVFYALYWCLVHLSLCHLLVNWGNFGGDDLLACGDNFSGDWLLDNHGVLSDEWLLDNNGVLGNKGFLSDDGVLSNLILSDNWLLYLDGIDNDGGINNPSLGRSVRSLNSLGGSVNSGCLGGDVPGLGLNISDNWGPNGSDRLGGRPLNNNGLRGLDSVSADLDSWGGGLDHGSLIRSPDLRSNSSCDWCNSLDLRSRGESSHRGCQNSV